VPPVADQTHTQIQRLIELLRHQVQCHIITVKPKEVGKMLDSWGKMETIS
jgi:ribonuclease HIII